MSGFKLILVNYLERNKVFKIPGHVPDEIAYLEEEFRKEFKFHDNVSIFLSFQRYDKDWDDYVEIEKGQSKQLHNKEKLKVVVSPLLRSDNSNVSQWHQYS